MSMEEMMKDDRSAKAATILQSCIPRTGGMEE
jgi:hypothetical protein